MISLTPPPRSGRATIDPAMFQGITIDPPGTRDRDDAIRVQIASQATLVEVAFPDLTGLIAPGGDYDRAAAEIGTTIYGRAGIARAMLPLDITEQASLDLGPPSPVFVIRVRLEPDGAIRSADLRRDIFMSRGSYTYAEASRMIRDRDVLGEEITLASGIAHRLYQRRVAEGALVHYDLQRGLITNEEGAVRQVDVTGVRAEVLIAEFMILANRCLAQICAENGLPILYRNHRARPAASRSDLLADLEHQDPQILARQDMVLDSATLEPVSAGHYGLNLPGYAWFTSPLRRYADLVNQRALGHWLDGAPASNDDLAEIGRYLTDLTQRRAAEKSAYLKTQAQKQHAALLGSDLTRVTDEALSKVIEIAGRTQTVPQSLEDEILRRLPGGRLGIPDLFNILPLSPKLGSAALAHIASQRPQDTMGVYGYGATKIDLATPTFDTQMAGKPNEPTFTVIGRVRHDGRDCVSAPSVANTTKAARNGAVLGLLAEIFGLAAPTLLPPDPYPTAPVNTKGPAATPAKVRPATTSNAKGALLEMCQKRHIAPPTFRVERTGPDHQPRFTAWVSVGTKTSGPCQGENRKEAEHRVSAAWMADHAGAR